MKKVKSTNKKELKEVGRLCWERGLPILFYLVCLSVLKEDGIEEVRRRIKLFDKNLNKEELKNLII